MYERIIDIKPGIHVNTVKFQKDMRRLPVVEKRAHIAADAGLVEVGNLPD